MKRKMLEKKSAFGALLVTLMLTAATLTGCASGQTAETAVIKESAEATAEETDNAEEVTAGAEKASDAEAKEEADSGTEKEDGEAEEAVSGTAKAADGETEKGTAAGTEGATEEDAAEVADGTEETSEEVVYEGIDMESTLPGLEWIATFDGIITEPKFVIFNDKTNKKVIVENGQEVEFCDTDVFAVFLPLVGFGEGGVVYRKDLEDNLTFKHNWVEKNVRYYDDVSARVKDGDKVEIKQEYEIKKEDGTDDEEVILTTTLVIKKK